MNHLLKKTHLLLACCLMAVAVLTGCKDNGVRKHIVGDISNLTGIWHYEWVSRTVQGAGADTLYQDMTREKDAPQYYDEYGRDSTLVYRIFQNDSLQEKVLFRFELRNDSLFVRNDLISTCTHILELTDSTMLMEYTQIHNDTTFYLQSRCRRSPLPEGVE